MVAAKKMNIATEDNYELPAVTNVQAVKGAVKATPEPPKVSPDDIKEFITEHGGSPMVNQIDYALKLFLENKDVSMLMTRLNDLESDAKGVELTTINAIKAKMK